ncbi:hypothetical protein [Mycobacterium celatum]|uniref:hypothetical protein n=1 Tax=Mycobacterium celatum TaxID=28045 RepID=UPI000A8980AD|nr:hypothetical protein [Mycobacterium celatum]
MRDVFNRLLDYASGSTGYLPIEDLLPPDVVEPSTSSDAKWEMAVACLSGPAERLLWSDTAAGPACGYGLPSAGEIRQYAESHFPPIGGARSGMWDLARSIIADPDRLSFDPFSSAQRRRSALTVLAQAVQAVISLRLLDGNLKLPSDNPYDSVEFTDPSPTLVLNEDEILRANALWERQMYRWADGHPDSPSLDLVLGAPAAEGAIATSQQFFLTYLGISAAARNVLGDRWPGQEASVDTRDVETELGVQEHAHPLSWSCAGNAIILGTNRLPYDVFASPQQRASALLILLATARHVIRSMRDRLGPSLS